MLKPRIIEPLSASYTATPQPSHSRGSKNPPPPGPPPHSPQTPRRRILVPRPTNCNTNSRANGRGSVPLRFKFEVLAIPVDGVHCLEGSLTISLRVRNFILSRVKGVTPKLRNVYCRTFVSRGGSWRGCPPRTFRILSSRRKSSDRHSLIASTARESSEGE